MAQRILVQWEVNITNIVSGVLVGPALQKQTHAVGVTVRSSKNQRRACFLRLAWPPDHFHRKNHNMELQKYRVQNSMVLNVVEHYQRQWLAMSENLESTILNKLFPLNSDRVYKYGRIQDIRCEHSDTKAHPVSRVLVDTLANHQLDHLLRIAILCGFRELSLLA